MNYHKVIVTIVTKKNRGKMDADTLAYRVTFEGTDGEWSSSGSLLDVYTCDGLLVCTSPFNMRPVAIASTLNNLVEKLKERTKCDNITVK